MPVWLASVLGVVTFLIGGLVTAVWMLAGINKDVERMKDDIGTYDKGMRHDVQQAAIALTELGAEVRAAVDRLESLHGWKHRVGDAYLPRAVDEHERRLDRLDDKVFNGGSHK